MKHLFILSITILLSAPVDAQKKLYINYTVDTTNADVRKAIHFYNQYLDEFKGEALPDFTKYWSKEDCENYHCPDPIIYGIAGDYPTYSFAYPPVILYIKPEKDYIHIKTSFLVKDSVQYVSTLCITNHYIRFDEHGNPQFISPVTVNSKHWQTRKAGNITYFFPHEHVFDERLADSMQVKIKKLEKDWSLNPINIRYYFAENSDDINRLRGFDYALGMGNRNIPTGISNYEDKLIYCGGGLGENYFHEAVHLYLNSLSPKHSTEGLAEFYGGSLGHPLSWHLHRMKEYFNKLPELDILKSGEIPEVNDSTNVSSVIQGLLCLAVYKRDGMEGLKRVIKYNSTDDIYEKEFHVALNDRSSFIRKLLNDQ